MAHRKAQHRLAARMKTGARGHAALVPVSGAVSGGQASPGGTPMQMPLQTVIVQPVSSQYVTLGSAELVPMIAADGAPIPATAPGRWGQLRQAGRP